MNREVKTLCPYCGVGCGLIATTDGRQILRVRGDKAHPANLGKLCPKGATVSQTVNVSSRLRYAMVREPKSTFQIASNARAADHVAENLNRIRQEHGPEAIAFYLSGQLTTEAQYIANKFAKGFLGTNHVDSNSRLCMSSAASGMYLSLGSDGPPTSYSDIDLADTFLFIGSNAAECHPVTFERVLSRIESGHAEAIVVDPRRTATAEHAALHLPIRPATDLALLNGLLHILRNIYRINEQFIASRTEGWNELSAMLDAYTPTHVAEICGIDREDLILAAQMIAKSKRLITFWTMGVNQHLQGTFTVNAIINLHLGLGQIGKPGCGPFSLTGQPNAMGGRDVGYMSHTLPGQRFINNPQHRAEMERFWNIPEGSIKQEPGHDAVKMFDAIDQGKIKALWIIGSNPAASMPNLPVVKRALEKCEFVIVQDAYFPTETTRFAHVILPAAVNLEQEGTFCNSERRVTLMERVVDPPGEAQPDWWWIREVARSMGLGAAVNYESAASIFDEFARSTAGRPNDQSGMYHSLLRKMGPQQWPMPAMGKSSERRYMDQVFPTASGKARFWARPHEVVAEKTSAEFPLILTTGRDLNQWHTRTKTGLVEQLNNQSCPPAVQIHPDDARQLSLENGKPVRIVSRRGHAMSVVKIDRAMSPGIVCMPIHWNDLFAPLASPNEVTSDQTDPISKQPTLKYCAVTLVPCSAN